MISGSWLMTHTISRLALLQREPRLQMAICNDDVLSDDLCGKRWASLTEDDRGVGLDFKQYAS